MKTNRGAAKRFRITASGKVMQRKAWDGHLKKSKTASHKTRLAGNAELKGGDAKAIRRMLGR